MNKNTIFNGKTFHYLNCFKSDCYQCYNYSIDLVDVFVNKWELINADEAPNLFIDKPKFCFTMNYSFYHEVDDSFWKRKTSNDWYLISQRPQDELDNELFWYRYKEWFKIQINNNLTSYEDLIEYRKTSLTT
jgi:hypothetical protein